MKLLEPKLDFLKSNQAAQFADLLGNPVLREGIQAALLQFVLDQPTLDGLEQACRQNYQIEGAKLYVKYLLNLTEAESAPAKPSPQNLQWQRPQSQQKQPLLKPQPETKAQASQSK